MSPHPALWAALVALAGAVALDSATAARPDRVPPTTTVTSPVNAAVIHGTVRLEAAATDKVGVTRVDFFLDSLQIASDATAPWSVDWDSTRAADGSHVLVAKARDAAGNVGTSAPVTIVVDNVPELPPPPSPTTPNPLTCEGYPEKRIFLESQSWWYDTRSQSDGESSHVHVGTCFPLFQQIAGRIKLDIRVLVHNDRGASVNAVRVQVNEPGGSNTIWRDTTSRPVCDAHDCTFWFQPQIDLSALSYGGLVEFRFHGETRRPNGDLNRASSGWFANVDNGKPAGGTNAVRAPTVEARGWYELNGRALGYENALIRSAVPLGPVCGTWRIKVQTKAGADGGVTPTSSVLAIDPNLHAGIRGTVVSDGSGPLLGEFAVDTTRLANGPHKLLIGSRANRETDERLAGALVIPFRVDNSLPCAAPSTVEPMWYANAAYSPVSGETSDVILDAFAPGATRIDYLIDGRTAASDASGPSFDDYFDLSLLESGPHTLVARATIDGVVRDSLPVPFTTRR